MLIPSELIQVKQWLCWWFEIRNGKRTKVPIDPLTGKRASSTNPISWADFYTALKAVNERGSMASGLFSPRMTHTRESTWTTAGTRRRASLQFGQARF